MPHDLDQLVDGVLADYSRVEPAPGAVATWMAHSADSPRPASRFLSLPAPAWAAIALALLILLALSWYRAGVFARQQPRLASESTSLRALSPNTPLTPEQKKLMHILLTNPAALSKIPAPAAHVH